MVLDRIAVYNTNTGAVAATGALSIYSDSASPTGPVYPGTLLTGGLLVPLNPSGVHAATINQALTAGLYWLTFQASISGPTMRALATAGCIPIMGVDNTLGTAWNLGAYVTNSSYTTPPTVFPSGPVMVVATPIAIYVRRSS
jgi:hypothetical protein